MEDDYEAAWAEDEDPAPLSDAVAETRHEALADVEAEYARAHGELDSKPADSGDAAAEAEGKANEDGADDDSRKKGEAK